MAEPLLPDNLWHAIEPLLPPEPPRPKGGRPRIPARSALTGILFVLKSGIPWGMLPQEMGCGSGVTCWRRLRDWNAAGVWRRLHELLLAKLHAADLIDWERACVDSGTVRGKRGRPRRRPKKLHADKGYDFGACRALLRERNITPRIARRGVESSERLGRYRWVIERTLSWLNRFRRLEVRCERRADRLLPDLLAPPHPLMRACLRTMIDPPYEKTGK